MGPTILFSVTATAALLCFSCGQGQKETLRTQCSPVLVDSLTAVFDDLKEAVRENQPDMFLDLLDSAEAAHLQRLIRQHGYTSLKSFIGRQFDAWPDLDTLNFYELRRAGDYVRLSFTGRGTKFGYKTERVKYTFLLFRKSDQRWKLAAMTSLEKEQYDPYGYEIIYHETELPPKLRFPRLL